MADCAFCTGNLGCGAFVQTAFSYGGVPILKTARLTMRGHTIDDLSASAAMWSNEAVVRHISGRPFTGEEVWARLLRYGGHWAHLGFGFWAVSETGTGQFIGEAGFADFKRDLGPSFAGKPEMGWALDPAAHGKGYATEIVHAALGWGAQHFGAVETVCMIAPENAASLRVADKCGFEEFARTSYHGEPCVLLHRMLAGQA